MEPTASQIEAAALKAGLTMDAVLKRASVHRESFYREKRGEGVMRQVTRDKLTDAIKALAQ